MVAYGCHFQSWPSAWMQSLQALEEHRATLREKRTLCRKDRPFPFATKTDRTQD